MRYILHNPVMRYAKSAKELRTHLGLTQSELAEKAGVNLSTVWRWEAEGIPRGLAGVFLKNLAKEAGFAGISRSAYRQSNEART